jgi:flagellar assembly factor FliW
MTTPSVDTSTLTFSSGMPGFPDARHFQLATLDEGDTLTGIYLLRSVDDPRLQFVVVAPPIFFPDYIVDLPDDEAAALELTDSADALLLLIATIAEDPAQSTANLFAPIVVNQRTLAAAQVVLGNSDYSLRAPLFG